MEEAVPWLMRHITDSDFADPFVPPGTESSSFTPNQEAIETLSSMGFTNDQAIKALKATDNNVERAMDWIFSHQDELNASSSPSGAVPTTPEFRDGEGSKYSLKNLLIKFTSLIFFRIQISWIYFSYGNIHDGRTLCRSFVEEWTMGYF